MNLQTRWFNLPVHRGSDILLVLEATRPDATGTNVIRDLATSLIQQLPHAASAHIAFLGSADIYSPAQARTQLQQLWPQHQGYLRVLAPIAEEARDRISQSPQMIVLASGSIHDIADWEEQPLLENARFFRCGANSPTLNRFREEQPRLELILNYLDNPITRIEIIGEGQLPLSWDENTFDWDKGQLTTIENLFSSPEGSAFAFVGPEHHIPSARMTYRDGRQSCQPLLPFVPNQSVGDWSVLSAQESGLVRQCISEGSYSCPNCKRTHRATELVCDQGHGLGTPVLESVPSKQRTIVLRERDGSFEWRPLGMHGFLASSGAFITSGKERGFYRFEEGQWRRENHDKPVFHLLQGGQNFVVRL